MAIAVSYGSIKPSPARSSTSKYGFVAIASLAFAVVVAVVVISSPAQRTELVDSYPQDDLGLLAVMVGIDAHACLVRYFYLQYLRTIDAWGSKKIRIKGHVGFHKKIFQLLAKIEEVRRSGPTSRLGQMSQQCF
jgi:hypothetical protein